MNAQHTIRRPGEADLESALHELAALMRLDLSHAERARMMNEAGDLCHEARDDDRALLYFDAAIDLYLADGRFAAARAICDKLLEMKPGVVRARCTLAWLAIACGLFEEAAFRIWDYGEAALALPRPAIAQHQLRAMAEEVDEPSVLESIANALLNLGDALAADRIFGLLLSPSGHRPRAYGTPAERDRAIVSRLTPAWSG